MSLNHVVFTVAFICAAYQTRGRFDGHPVVEHSVDPPYISGAGN